MNRMDDPLKVITDLRPVMLDHLIEHGYAERRDADLARAAGAGPARRPPARRRRRRAGYGRRRWYLVTGGIAVTATVAVAAVALSGTSPAGGRRPAPPAPRSRAAPPPHATPAQFTTARQVLLAAAAHVTRVPATGRYWRLQEISGVTWPAGTTAHPYDISLAVSFDQWNAKRAGQKSWDIFHELGASPATAADAAAWRAAGSPTTWHSGQQPTRQTRDGTAAGVPWTGELAATTAAAARGASWQVSNGVVGYIEGDLAGLTAAQFRQLPATPAGVKALLRQYYVETNCPSHPAGCSTEGQFLWSEALALLQDPVSAPVRSATFKVMASLPGVRLLGPMTDPLGRHGYGLAAGPNGLSFGGYHPVQASVIDPGTGALLATEDIGPVPRDVQCLTFRVAGGNSAPGAPVVKVGTVNGKPIMGTCAGSSYEGRSYPDQVDRYTALVSAGWTSASPALPPPSTWTSDGSLPGDPTLLFVPCDRTGC
jgi:hypothetical protein